MPRPKQRTEELRDHILEVTIAKLEAEGAGAVTARAVAREAATSTPAVYELFGDKAGLIRAVFYEGFRRLGVSLTELEPTDDLRADLGRVMSTFRSFVRDNPVLAQVMFSRPFADFDPGSQEQAAGNAVRRCFVENVQRCVEAGIVAGEPTDLAHVLLAVAQGLSAQESAGWLGTTQASRDRRWRLALDAVLGAPT